MKTTGLALPLLALCLAAPGVTEAESLGGYGALTYQVSFPFGATHQFSADVSWLGVGLDLQFLLTPSVSLGIATGWNAFSGNTSAPFAAPSGEITGSQHRTTNLFPLLADVRVLGGSAGGVRPFVGLGLGGYLFLRSIEHDQTSSSWTRFQLGLAPEVGILLPIHHGVGVQLSVRYNVAFAAGSWPFQNWLSLCITPFIGPGFAWGSAL